MFLQVDGNKEYERDDFEDIQSTFSLDTESNKESSGDDNLCSSQLSKDISPGQRLPAVCTYNLKAC